MAAPLGSPVKDSPTFEGLWYDTGRVVYQGLPGGDADGQSGGWGNFDMTTNVPPTAKELHDLASASLPQPVV